jgi:uncharacterized protein
VYDHRGYGSSDGEPRSETNIWQQVEDAHDALTFVRSLGPEVDPDRVCIWGIGHSGGMSMVAAALDPRIKAAIIVMPFTSGSSDVKFFPMQDVWENRKKQKTEWVPIWPATREAAEAKQATTLLSGIDAWDFIAAGRKKTLEARGEPMPNQLSLQSFYHISRIEPKNYIHLIAPKPLLYIAAETDKLTGPIAMHREVFQLAGEPKEFVELKNHHLATYFGETFEENVGKQVDFVKRRL